jgi:hypothetical protein
MYILIKEDTNCAERTPPWGAPDIEHYIDRLRQNIATLKKFPQIKIGYEWSGLELEQLAEDAPEVFQDMMELVKNGQTTFYNGTYAQPHLQTLSSEANYRQFEWGARVYRNLCENRQPLVYAHQESSLNDQTPQLLKVFGIRYGVLPHFSCTMSSLGGGEILYHARYGTMFMHGEEFAGWRGLDGTVEDLYLEEPRHMNVKDWINFQEVLGCIHNPPVMVEIPDLIDVDEKWINDRAQADFSLLDDVLEERRKAFPPRFQTRLYTNWSYIEGIRAEELSRNDWQAEISVLRAEALNSMAFTLLNRAPDSTDPLWKKILTTQHHDVYCFCAPELREKSVCWLQEAEAEASSLAGEAAQAIAEEVDTQTSDGQPVVVFNTLPHTQQAIVTAEVALHDPKITDLAGSEMPSEAVQLPNGKTQVRFVAEMSGLGYRTFQVQAGGQPSVEGKFSDPFVFENGYYRATVQPDGTFTSLVLKLSGDELLQGSVNPANMLAAHDSTGLGPQHEGTFNILKWEKWEPSGRGPELHWQPTGPAQVRRSPLGATLTIPGEMSDQVKATLQACFYNDLARIDLDWIFTFNEASIGHFFDDDTKLRVQWPLSFKGGIHHDISFGVVDTRDERPFLPASWVDVSDGKKGLAYFHQGTIKHWVTGQTLVNLFAWGEYTDAIGNRLDLLRWPKCFDQRLRGTHTIHTAIYPHAGDWRTADVIGAARSYGTPPVAYLTGQHTGKLPAAQELLRLENPEIAATAVKVVDGQVLCRLYSVAEQPEPVAMLNQGLEATKAVSLFGDTIDNIAPFQIAQLFFDPQGK